MVRAAPTKVVLAFIPGQSAVVLQSHATSDVSGTMVL